MSEIVKSVSIENLLNQRQAVTALLAKGLEAITEAARLAKFGSMGFPDVVIQLGGQRCSQIDLCSSRKTADDTLTQCTKAVDAGAWKHLMCESGLLSLMDAKARDEWHRKVHERDVPPLTFENIHATFSNLHESRGDMFERGVIECYRKLNWNYRTNQPFKFGKKIIVERMFSTYGNGKARYLSTNHNSTNELDDLERVFKLLDDKPEPDHRNGWFQRLSMRESKAIMFAETDYLEVKWFLKGTGHVTFKRPDLVEKMNQILVKHFPNALAYEARS